MKKNLLCGLLLSTFSIIAASVNVEKMDETERQNYLINLSIEVVKNLGPDFLRTEKSPVVSGPFICDEEFDNEKEYSKYFGRKYYAVDFLYNEGEGHLNGQVIGHGDYCSRVEIWADKGDPKSVMYGTGIGHRFYGISYAALLEEYKGNLKDIQVSYPERWVLYHFDPNTGQYDSTVVVP